VRLERPAREQPLAKRPMHLLMRMRMGAVPDVVLATHHRPEFFGRPFLAWVDQELRTGPSPLSKGERELIAAAVSRANSCKFCIASHTATSTALLGEALAADALDETRRASLSPALRATLEFVERLTLDPAAIGPDDVRRAIDAGATIPALRSAIEICAAFNVINRVADALDFEVPEDRSFAIAARMLIRFGYS
jgi:uncharacterized peroxidase-related enzyme